MHPFRLLVAILVARESVFSSNPCLAGPADVSTFPPKRLFLTFNDGPTNGTGSVLTVLANHNIKATFYLSGSRFDPFLHGTGTLAKESVESLHELAVKGHQIGSHSFSDFPDTDYSDTVACSYHKSALWNQWDFVFGTQAVAAELSCAPESQCNSTFALSSGLNSAQLAIAYYQLTTFLRLPCYSYWRTMNESNPPMDPNTTNPVTALADWLPENFKQGGGLLTKYSATPDALVHGWHTSWVYDANLTFKLVPSGINKDDVEAYGINNSSAVKSACLMADQIDRQYLLNQATGGRVVWLAPDRFFEESAQQRMLDQLLHVLGDRGYTFERMEAYEPLPWQPPMVQDDDDDDDGSESEHGKAKRAYLFTMVTAVVFFALLLLWYGVIVPALEGRGCVLPSCGVMSVVHGMKSCCGCDGRRTQISKWSDSSRYNEKAKQVAPKQSTDGFKVVNRETNRTRGLSFFTEWVSDLMSTESDFSTADDTFDGGDGEEGIELSGGFVHKANDDGPAVGRSVVGVSAELSMKEGTVQEEEEGEEEEGGEKKGGGDLLAPNGAHDSHSRFAENVTQSISRLHDATEQLTLAIAREEEGGSYEDDKTAASYYRKAGDLFAQASEARVGTGEASTLQAPLRTKADHCKHCAAELEGRTLKLGRTNRYAPFVHIVYDVSRSFDLLVYETVQNIYSTNPTPGNFQQAEGQGKLYDQLKQQLVEKLQRRLSTAEKDRMSCIMEIFIALVHESHDSADIAKLKMDSSFIGNPLASNNANTGNPLSGLSQPSSAERFEEDDILVKTASNDGSTVFAGNNPGTDTEAGMHSVTVAGRGEGRGNGLRVGTHVSANPAITFDDVEMTTARYTAVTTSDPKDFSSDGNVLKVRRRSTAPAACYQHAPAACYQHAPTVCSLLTYTYCCSH
jgi:hypothetical protein